MERKALAAVGSTGTIMFLIYGFVVGMTAGFTVLTAQKFGAGDMQGCAHRCGGRNPFVVGRSVSYGYLYVIYETTFASDEYSV